MQAEDIQRLKSLEGDHKVNIKAIAAQDILTAIHASLNTTEENIKDILAADYTEANNGKLMMYLATLRQVHKVTSTLDLL